MPRGQTAREHFSTSGEGSARLDVVSTGFRLLPKFDQSAKGIIAGPNTDWCVRMGRFPSARLGHEPGGRCPPVLQRRAG